ncbi:MAG: hypothetical protein R3F43_12165 [bacterium]
MADMIIIEYREKRLYSPRLGIYVLVFEITCKVTNDLFLLAPQVRMVDLLTGILARAQQRVGEEDGFAFDFDLYNYYFMSNHLHLLPGVVELVDKSLLLEWVCREIAKRVNKFHDRTGQCLIPNHAIQVVSEEHALDRMRYFMGQATAELKSRHPADDVFACANPALLRGEKLRGTFVRGDGRSEELTVRLDRLPGLGELTPKEHKALMWELADGIAAEARPRRKKAGLAGAGSGGRSVRRPDDAPQGAQAQPRAGGARHEGRPGGLARAPRRAEGRVQDRPHRLLEVAGRSDAAPLIPFPACTIPPSHARKKLRLRAESG